MTQVGFAGSAGGAWELRKSTSQGGWGDTIVAGHLGTTSDNGYYVANVDPIYLPPGYYTFNVYVYQNGYWYGTKSTTYREFVFLKSSSGTADVNEADGTYSIRLGYARVSGGPLPRTPTPLHLPAASSARTIYLPAVGRDSSAPRRGERFAPSP